MRCPLRTAMHAVASSVSAASANDVECRSGSRKVKRGVLIAGGCRSGRSGVNARVPDAAPHSKRTSAKRACRAGTGCRCGRAGMCRRSEACVRRADMRGREDARSSSRVVRTSGGSVASSVMQ
eukprot:6185350-Pleurochrysis_carterae.AAC.3